MKKIAKIYLIYAILSTIVFILYAINVHGPSRILFGLFISVLWEEFIRHNKENGESTKRCELTTIAAFSPGLIGITHKYKENKKLTTLGFNLLLFFGFFGGIISLGLLLIFRNISDALSSYGIAFLIIALCSIVFSYDLSVTSVNAYCDSKNMPYGDG